MYRAAFVGLLTFALGLAPKGCAKKPPPPEADLPLPPPVPLTSATTPPIWSPPEPAGTPTSATSTPPPPSPELVKARAAAEAKDFKKVKALLEKKARGGKCTPEEAQLVFRACVQLKDKACTEAVKAKHADDVSSIEDTTNRL